MLEALIHRGLQHTKTSGNFGKLGRLFGRDKISERLIFMRTIRDARLESRAARLRLAPQRQPHWKTVVPARLHLGYRRRQRNLPGTWLLRHYVGEERYRVAPLGLADDFHDAADGVIDFAEAQRRALTHKLSAGTRPGGPTAAWVGRSDI